MNASACTLAMLNVLAQTTVVCGVGLAAASLLQQRGAALRSAVLRATLAAALVCPLCALTLDQLGVRTVVIALPTPEESPAPPPAPPMAVAPAAWDDRAPLGLVHADPPVDSLAADSLARAPRRFPPVSRCAAAVWLALTALLLMRLAWSHTMLLHAWTKSRPAPLHVQELCRSLAASIGVSPPPVHVSTSVRSPLLLGVIAPAILLPRDGEPVSRPVLLHELAHLLRRDCAWLLLARITTALYWWQPLVWMASRRLEDACDEVCDDYVLCYGSDATGYAKQLVMLAERYLPSAVEAVAATGVIALRSSLGRRVQRILDGARKTSLRVGIGGHVVIAVIMTCAVMVVGACGVGTRKQPEEKPAPSVAQEVPLFQIRPVLDPNEETDAAGFDVFSTTDSRGRVEELRVSRVVVVDENDIQSATPVRDPQTGEFEVSVEFTQDGTRKFAEATGKYVGRELAIIVGGRVVSHPVVREPIRFGTCRISGRMTAEQAKALAERLHPGGTDFPDVRLLLGNVDPTDITAARQAQLAHAASLAAEADLLRASEEYMPGQRLFEGGHISSTELRGQRLRAAEANAKYLEARLDEARKSATFRWPAGVGEAARAARLARLDAARVKVEVLREEREVLRGQIAAGVAPNTGMAALEKDLEAAEAMLSALESGETPGAR